MRVFDRWGSVCVLLCYQGHELLSGLLAWKQQNGLPRDGGTSSVSDRKIPYFQIVSLGAKRCASPALQFGRLDSKRSLAKPVPRRHFR